MSHFSVLIVLPAGIAGPEIETEIGRRMAPWDENREVDPYRSYEEGSAEEFWFTRAVRRGAAELAAGKSGVQYDRFLRSWSVSGGGTFDTEADALEYEQRNQRDDARDAEEIGDLADWETVVRVFNARFGYGKELAHASENWPSGTMFYDPETDRAYTMSTCNPESKWDYWRIGGRWGQGYFRIKQTGPGLIWAVQSWDSPKDKMTDELTADGAPKRLIDFEAMRAEAGRKAGDLYDKWHAMVAPWPTAKPWTHFYGLVQAGEMEIQHARDSYHRQSAIQAAHDSDDFRWHDDPVTEFGTTREEYVRQAERGAVPGYALVTLDGEWVAPGRVGWFGMSTDGPGEAEGYRIAVNEYLEHKVGDDDLIVVLDCHI